MTKHPTQDRPMSSHEIQQYLGRMPTRDERSAFSSWRNAHLNIDLETGLPAVKAPEPYTDDNRFMPRSWHIKRELEELLPGRAERICDLIEQLIEAKMAND